MSDTSKTYTKLVDPNYSSSSGMVDPNYRLSSRMDDPHYRLFSRMGDPHYLQSRTLDGSGNRRRCISKFVIMLVL